MRLGGGGGKHPAKLAVVVTLARCGFTLPCRVQRGEEHSLSLAVVVAPARLGFLSHGAQRGRRGIPPACLGDSLSKGGGWVDFHRW